MAVKGIWAEYTDEYTATPFACGWAGAVLEKATRGFGKSGRLKKLKNAEKVKVRPTDQPTDQRTD